MAALTPAGRGGAVHAAWGWLVPSTLFGRLAALLIVAVLASHVLALSLMWELRPAPPPHAGAARTAPPPPWMERGAASAPVHAVDAAGHVRAGDPAPPDAVADGRAGPQPGRERGEWMEAPGAPHGPRGLGHLLDAPLPLQLGLLLDITVRLAVLLLAAWWAARWLAQPMHRLARAAQELGRNLDRPPLPEDGPEECRDASRVFNQMQARLRQQLADRDGFVAAVSHDLRTPLTRLRLRAENLANPDEQQRFGRDIAEMDAMITATLDYLRGVAHAEPVALVDVQALVHSLADDLQDMGHDVTVRGHAAPMPVQAGALRRCLDNLVGNALRYGAVAELTLHDGPDALCICVRDQGPGLPDAELARVMAPFYRAEASRNRDSGGVGLGLTIAQDIVHRHGGQLRLSNSPQGGLLAEVVLPRSPVMAPPGLGVKNASNA